MPSLNGFDMLKRLPKNRRPFIIFLTAYDEYALRAFEVQALDYLLKPIDSERFAEAIERARRQIKFRTADSIEARLRGLLAEHGSRPDRQIPGATYRWYRQPSTFVMVDEIDWIASRRRLCRLTCREQQPFTSANVEFSGAAPGPREIRPDPSLRYSPGVEDSRASYASKS